jgi:enoyl-CoA hydratase/carnithine racemase
LGNDVACLADIRIASKNARFGVTFLKIGLIPGDGGAWLLPKIIGLSMASELLFTGKLINADQAKECGLISEVFEESKLMIEANNLAQSIVKQPPDALRMTKKLLREGMISNFETMLEMSANMQALMHLTEDHQEAITAFFEKRDGNFKGK